MRCRDLLGKQVLSLDDVAHIGTASDVVFDLEGKFVALVVRRPGFLTRYGVVLAEGVESIGPDAITAHTDEAADSDQVAALKGLPTMRSVRHTVAMTSRGTYLGTIDDLVFDPETRRVTQYLIRGKAFASRFGLDRSEHGGALPANGRIRFGRRLTIFWEDELIRLQPWPAPELGDETVPINALEPARVAVSGDEAGPTVAISGATDQAVQ